MQQFDILDPTLDVFQSRFLEASAGTGKTFTIEHLFVRLLLESKNSLDLNQILAVTFTKEAAREMKTRIRAKLESMDAQDALAAFDEVQIFTIHGFCNKMLTEFAFEAKAPLQMEEEEYLVQMRQVIEDFFRTANPHFSHDVQTLLKRSRYDLDRLIMRLIHAMHTKDEPAAFALNVPKISLDALRADVTTLAPRYKRFNLEAYKHQFEFFTKLHEEPSLLLKEKEWFFEKMHEENAKVSAKHLSTYSLKAPGFLEEIHKTLVPHLAIARDPDQMLKRIAHECRLRWEIKAKRNEIFTFDDLLLQMERALHIPAFLHKVQSKYRVAIVDEFQDTDPIQWKIFETLFLKTHLIYLVGDPKQSIYGFRNADIYTYLDAAKALGEEKKAYLDTNFRSSPPLIKGLNALFTKRPNWMALPLMPLEYHPVKAGRSETLLDEPPIQGFSAEAQVGRERSWPTKQLEEEKLFPYIAQEILRLHQTYSLSFSEMAILVKDRFQGQRMQLHLNRWKIPSTIKRTLNLNESRGFMAMEMLLKATQHPENDKLVRGVLLGPLMETKASPFYELKTLFVEEGFARFFSTFLTHYFKGDGQLYLELKQTAEILMHVHDPSFEELLHLMEELKEMSPEEDERLKLRGEEGENHVPIMTTFASKGLEFDVVFALGMASRHFTETLTQDQEAEKLRQLYVAFTRPREKLYIPLVFPLGRSSPIEQFFSEWETFDFPIEPIGDIPIQPYSAQQETTPASPARQYRFNFPIKTLTSFSSLAKPQGHAVLKERFQAQDLTQKTTHTLPLGAETGTVIHAVFEKIFEERSLPIEQIVLETLIGTHLEGWEEVIAHMAHQVLDRLLFDNFSLNDLKEGDYYQEMEFLFPQENQWIKGFADLVFKQENTFYVLDWKTNWLGTSDADYTEENMKQAMHEHDYYLQAKLYSDAVQRYVKPLYKEPKFGGAFYLFLRGKQGVHIG